MSTKITGRLVLIASAMISTMVVTTVSIYTDNKEGQRDDIAAASPQITMHQDSAAEKGADAKNRLAVLESAMKHTIHSGDNPFGRKEIGAISAPLENSRAHRALAIKEVQEKYFDMAPIVLEEMFQEQKRDYLWSRSVEREIDDIVDDDRIAGSELEVLDCRDSLCKVQVILPSQDEKRDFMDLWTMKGPYSGRNFGSHQDMDDGRVEATVYFTKENVTQPFAEMKERMISRVERW